nr:MULTISPECIES: PEP-CTERM sorting domain-containing protein [unclassified Massilia]
MSGIAQAKVIELVPQAVPGTQPGILPVHAQAAAAPAPDAFSLPSGISELPEPEVFAMMLVGLVLLGYRARRDSREKFK